MTPGGRKQGEVRGRGGGRRAETGSEKMWPTLLGLSEWKHFPCGSSGSGFPREHPRNQLAANKGVSATLRPGLGTFGGNKAGRIWSNILRRGVCVCVAAVLTAVSRLTQTPKPS